MLNYSAALELAKKHEYSSFTALQECAFSSEEAYCCERDLFVVGQTSSGKTLIPLLLYALAVKEAKEAGEDCPKMLFVVPYRALAAQKLKELCEFFKNEDLNIIQSTGEFRQDDDLIQAGEVDIAVIITEKVFKYEARNSGFLSMYDYLVLDEIGLIDNMERGVRLDFIFAWAHSQRVLTGKPRTIALGTPFYDWSAYIDGYGFFRVETQERPVRLSEVAVQYTYDNNGPKKLTIQRVEGACDFLHPMQVIPQKVKRKLQQKYEVPMTSCSVAGCWCPMEEAARHDPQVSCPVTGQSCSLPIEYVDDNCPVSSKYILLQICRAHLQQGHQILVFVNNREQVKELCRFLCSQLSDLLPTPPSPEECEKRVLAKCRLDGEDVFGILEYEDGSAVGADFYQAFCGGVGFHSAALPNELRTYVEEKFLESREMKIVCSTETLAFGVNSTVDVVVIADLYKHDNEDSRVLTMNEYQNYVGRAGRLRAGVSADTLAGYVYTLVRKSLAGHWEDMKGCASVPQRLYSRFHSDNGQTLPFFVLNILPEDSVAGMTVEQLVDVVSTLPNDGTPTSESLTRKVEEGIRFLKKQRLATEVRTRAKGRNAVETKTRYCLTAMGIRLRGYILTSDDYIQLQLALNDYLEGIFQDSDRITFLYKLLQTKHAEKGLNTIFSASETRQNPEQLKEFIRQHVPPHSNCPEWLDQCDNEQILSFLAAILAWTDGESAKTLYRQFGIHYALLARVAEQVAYLVGIAEEILPFRMETVWEEKRDIYESRMKLSMEAFQAQIAVKKEEMHHLFVSVFFGINTEIAAKLLNFLEEQADGGNDPQAAELARELSLHRANPESARTHRRIAVRYRFFQTLPPADGADVAASNNYSNQRWQYRKDVEEMGPYIEAFFRSTFGSTFAEN